MSVYMLSVDELCCDCKLHDKYLILLHGDLVKGEIPIEDIIRAAEWKNSETNGNIDIHHIKKLENYQWILEKTTFSGEYAVCQEFLSDIRQRINQEKQRPKRLLVIMNPFSGAKQSGYIYEEKVAPLFEIAGIETIVKVSEKHEHVVEIISEFDCNTVDGIVLCGGDGTYNQGMNALLRKTQQKTGIDFDNAEVNFHPTNTPIGVIPTGSGNYICRMLCGCKDIETAALHIIKGSKKRLPMIGLYNMRKFVTSAAIAMAFGVDADMHQYLDGYRWMGMLRYLFIPFYYYAWKSLPLFEAQLTKRLVPQEETTAEEDHADKEGMPGKYLSVAVVYPNIILDECNIQSDLWIHNYLVLTEVTECGRMQLMRRQFDRIFKTAHYKLPQDFIKKNNVTGFKMKMKPNGSEEKQSYTVLLDSEFIQLRDLDVEVRVHDPVVSVFSGL